MVHDDSFHGLNVAKNAQAGPPAELCNQLSFPPEIWWTAVIWWSSIQLSWILLNNLGIRFSPSSSKRASRRVWSADLPPTWPTWKNGGTTKHLCFSLTSNNYLTNSTTSMMHLWGGGDRDFGMNWCFQIDFKQHTKTCENLPTARPICKNL